MLANGEPKVAALARLAGLAQSRQAGTALPLLNNALLLRLELQVQDRHRPALDRLLKSYLRHHDGLPASSTALAEITERPRLCEVLTIAHSAGLALASMSDEILWADPSQELTDETLFSSHRQVGERSPSSSADRPLDQVPAGSLGQGPSAGTGCEEADAEHAHSQRKGNRRCRLPVSSIWPRPRAAGPGCWPEPRYQRRRRLPRPAGCRRADRLLPGELTDPVEVRALPFGSRLGEHPAAALPPQSPRPSRLSTL